jgi:hypothetical protein
MFFEKWDNALRRKNGRVPTVASFNGAILGRFFIGFNASALELVHAEKPKILYHYAGQNGLLGIFKSRSLCVSSVRHLNAPIEPQVGKHVRRIALF